MRRASYLCIVLFLALSVNMQAQQVKPGPHGGKVKEAGTGYKIEMLYSRGNFYTFLLDANSKPMGNKGISCELNICFNTCENENHVLKIFSTDGFSAEDMLVKDFYSCMIIFTLNEEKIRAEFYNEEESARNE
ncbi:MAG: hypothetical protein ACJ76F_08430 [Bacteroidia bacterium]